VVAIAAATADERAQVAVDGLDDTEGDLVPTVGEDSFEVVVEGSCELLEGGQALPAQAQQPVDEEAKRRPFVAVTIIVPRGNCKADPVFLDTRVRNSDVQGDPINGKRSEEKEATAGRDRGSP
jgi:hypothetical protein